jgi:ethanolamine permease
MISAVLVLWLASSIPPGALALSRSTEPLLAGFRALHPGASTRILSLVTVIGLAATMHPVIFAFGRQIFSLSRAGYLPRSLSVTRAGSQTPAAALAAGAGLSLLVMIMAWALLGPARGEVVIAGVLVNMAVFAALLSYLAQCAAFIVLRLNFPRLRRPFRSPMGIAGPSATIAVACLTLAVQFHASLYRTGAVAVTACLATWFVAFLLIRRDRLMPSPEEAFAFGAAERRVAWRPRTRLRAAFRSVSAARARVRRWRGTRRWPQLRSSPLSRVRRRLSIRGRSPPTGDNRSAGRFLWLR